MRIGILTQYYPPEMGAPQARLSHLAGQFVRHGHEVVVLTAMPNYPRGRIFPGYRGFLRRETRDGVSVIRCWLYTAQSARLRPRLASYLSFVLSSLGVGLFCLGRLDYLMTESPLFFSGSPDGCSRFGRGRAGSSTSRTSGPRVPFVWAWCRTDGVSSSPIPWKRSATAMPGL